MCEALTYGDLSDWRLPDRNELVSLMIPGTTASDFPGMPRNRFWSSTSRAFNPTMTREAWYVSFLYGKVQLVFKGGGDGMSYYVRCVRGGP